MIRYSLVVVALILLTSRFAFAAGIDIDFPKVISNQEVLLKAAKTKSKKDKDNEAARRRAEVADRNAAIEAARKEARDKAAEELAKLQAASDKKIEDIATALSTSVSGLRAELAQVEYMNNEQEKQIAAHQTALANYDTVTDEQEKLLKLQVAKTGHEVEQTRLAVEEAKKAPWRANLTSIIAITMALVAISGQAVTFMSFLRERKKDRPAVKTNPL